MKHEQEYADRVTRQNAIEDLRKTHPEFSRTDYYRHAPREMAWLLKREEDRQWLNSILPKAKQWGHKVDWAARDRKAALQVAHVRKKLIEQDQLATLFLHDLNSAGYELLRSAKPDIFSAKAASYNVWCIGGAP
jgi:hypothetical protein